MTRRYAAASFQEDDLFLAYIAGMDTFAKGLRATARLLEDGVFESFKAKRYESYGEGIGKDIVGDRVGFSELEAYALIHGVTENTSGRQEYLESILNQYILEG